jgi:hypothetical protein
MLTQRDPLQRPRHTDALSLARTPKRPVAGHPDGGVSSRTLKPNGNPSAEGFE